MNDVSIDLQKRVISDFEKLFMENESRLKSVGFKDACLLAFLSGAQLGVEYVKELEDEELETHEEDRD